MIRKPTQPPVLVTILLNTRPEAMFMFTVGDIEGGYRPGDKFEVAWRLLGTYPLDTNFTREAQDIFVAFNRDDRPNGQTHRSLSIGDVVLFETPYGKIALAVESEGFSPVPVEQVEQYAAVSG